MARSLRRRARLGRNLLSEAGEKLHEKKLPVSVAVALVLAVVLALVASASGLHAQQSGQDRRGDELPVAIVTPDDIQFKTSAFTFVRIQYSGVADTWSWSVDWPAADRSFSALFQNLTGLSTNGDGLVLELTDSNLSRYPFIYIVEGGRMSLSEGEVAGLRDYLLGGGFLWLMTSGARKNGNRFAPSFAGSFPIENRSNSRPITRSFGASMSSQRSRRS